MGGGGGGAGVGQGVAESCILNVRALRSLRRGADKYSLLILLDY